MDGRAVCGECRLVLTPAVTIGDLSDPVGFGPLVEVAVSPSGLFAVSSTTFPGQLNIYSPEGDHLRTVGGSGDGPGEFRGESLLAFDRGDSLHVMARRGTRYTVLSPDFDLVRTATLPAAVTGFCLDGRGSVLAVAPAVAGERVAFLHQFSRSGDLQRSLDSRRIDQLDPRTMTRWIACGPDGTVWTSGGGKYQVEQWSPEEGRLRRLIAERPWLTRDEVRRSGSVAALRPGQASPKARLIAVSADAAGRTWVFVSVPGEECCEGDEAAAHDTWIEVVDPESGALLVQQRFDEVLRPLDGGRLYSLFQDELGERYIRIWTVRIEGLGK